MLIPGIPTARRTGVRRLITGLKRGEALMRTQYSFQY